MLYMPTLETPRLVIRTFCQVVGVLENDAIKDGAILSAPA